MVLNRDETVLRGATGYAHEGGATVFRCRSVLPGDEAALREARPKEKKRGVGKTPV